MCTIARYLFKVIATITDIHSALSKIALNRAEAPTTSRSRVINHGELGRQREEGEWWGLLWNPLILNIQIAIYCKNGSIGQKNGPTGKHTSIHIHIHIYIHIYAWGRKFSPDKISAHSSEADAIFIRAITRRIFFKVARTHLADYRELINTSSSMVVTVEIIYDAKSGVFNF